MSSTNTYKFKEPTKIPPWIKEKLHAKMRLYGKEPWFAKAWANYISLCRITSVRDLPDPDAFFEQEQLKHGISFTENDLDNSLYAAEELANLEDFEDEDEDDDYEEFLDEDLEEL